VDWHKLWVLLAVIGLASAVVVDELQCGAVGSSLPMGLSCSPGAGLTGAGAG